MPQARLGRAKPPADGGFVVFGQTAARLIRTAFALAVLLPVAALIAVQVSGPRVLAGVFSAGHNSSLDFAARGPADRLADAATLFADAAGGSGITFTVVSRSALHAKKDGPLIEIPDPFDRFKTLGFGTEYYLGASIAEGIASSQGFWLQMRQGPTSADTSADFANSEVTLAALVRDGKTWRNDGEGWYQTDQPPGIGLDTNTVALLPDLLRQASDAKVTGDELVDGLPVAIVEATGKIENAPGLMGIDAAAFTQLVGPLAFALDDQGRLVELRATMRNTNIEIFDLLVDAVVSFAYATPPPLPDPLPEWVQPSPDPKADGQ